MPKPTRIPFGPWSKGINRARTLASLEQDELFDAVGVYQDEVGGLKGCFETVNPVVTFTDAAVTITGQKKVPKRVIYWPEDGKMWQLYSADYRGDSTSYTSIRRQDTDRSYGEYPATGIVYRGLLYIMGNGQQAIAIHPDYAANQDATITTATYTSGTGVVSAITFGAKTISNVIIGDIWQLASGNRYAITDVRHGYTGTAFTYTSATGVVSAVTFGAGYGYGHVQAGDAITLNGTATTVLSTTATTFTVDSGLGVIATGNFSAPAQFTTTAGLGGITTAGSLIERFRPIRLGAEYAEFGQGYKSGTAIAETSNSYVSVANGSRNVTFGAGTTLAPWVHPDGVTERTVAVGQYITFNTASSWGYSSMGSRSYKISAVGTSSLTLEDAYGGASIGWGGTAFTYTSATGVVSAITFGAGFSITDVEIGNDFIVAGVLYPITAVDDGAATFTIEAGLGAIATAAFWSGSSARIATTDLLVALPFVYNSRLCAVGANPEDGGDYSTLYWSGFPGKVAAAGSTTTDTALGTDIFDPTYWDQTNASYPVGINEGAIQRVFGQERRMVVLLQNGIYAVRNNLPVDALLGNDLADNQIAPNMGATTYDSAVETPGNIIIIGTPDGVVRLADTAELIDRKVRKHELYSTSLQYAAYYGSRVYLTDGTDDPDRVVTVADGYRGVRAQYATTWILDVLTGEWTADQRVAASVIPTTSASYDYRPLYPLGLHGGIFSPYRTALTVDEQLLVAVPGGLARMNYPLDASGAPYSLIHRHCAHVQPYAPAMGNTQNKRVKHVWLLGPSTFERTVTLNALFPTAVPDAPTGLTVSPVDGAHGSLDLAWTAVGGTGVTYNIYRHTVTGGPYSLVTSGVSDVTYTDTGRTANTEYFYVIKAVNAAGASAYSAEASATTVLGAISWATLGAVTEVDGTITANWNTRTGATGYNVYKGATTDPELATTLVGSVVSPTTELLDATPAAPKYYFVSATNANGIGTISSAELGAIPAAPAAPVITADGGGDITGTIATVSNTRTPGPFDYKWYSSVNGGAYALLTFGNEEITKAFTPGDTVILKATSLRDNYESAQSAASNAVVVT